MFLIFIRRSGGGKTIYTSAGLSAAGSVLSYNKRGKEKTNVFSRSCAFVTVVKANALKR